jgi:hypothetical protein
MAAAGTGAGGELHEASWRAIFALESRTPVQYLKRGCGWVGSGFGGLA